MYYYIFERPLEAKEYERTANIKEYLASLGIAGEMVSPTESRTIEDLVQLAVGKRYSTIVAVGGIELVNQVARALEPYEIVFGIIPLKEHPDITSLIGTSDWKIAADQLKRRRWTLVRLGIINGTFCFITPASLILPEDASYELFSQNFTARGVSGTLRISPYESEDPEAGCLLSVAIEPPKSKKSFLGSLFGKNTPEPINSRFSMSKFEVHTDPPQPIQIAGSSLVSTPVTVEPQKKSIKLIVSRAAE